MIISPVNKMKMIPLGEICQTNTGGTPSRRNSEYFGGDIPHDWHISTIGETCQKFQYGWTTKANHNTGKLKLLRTTDITSGKINWDSVPFCSSEPKDIEKYLLKTGDILISRAGSVGESAIIENPHYAVFASYLIRFKPNAKIVLPRYLYYYLQSPAYWDMVMRDKSGIAVPNLNATKISKMRIFVSPLKEQKEIVARIEALFGRLDSVAKTVSMIKRMATICFDKFLSSAFNDSKAQKMTMGDISSIVGGSTPKTGDIKNYQNGSIAWITPADLSKYKDKYIAYGKRNITQQGLNSSSVHMLPKGAILFSSRAPIGYVAIATNDLCTNQGFKNFILNDKILPEYAYWWLKSIKNLAISMGSGTTFAELSKTNAQNLPFLYVPMKRQKEIVGRIEKIFSRLSFLSNRTHNMDNLMQQCRDSILSVEFAYNQRR